MKKLIVRIAAGVVVLLVLAVLAVHFFLDGAVRKAVETIGPRLAKVDVKLDSVSLSLLSGAGKVQGLVLGNPEGFRTPSAIDVGSASVSVRPGSLLSPKIVVRSVNVQGPEITLETGLKGSNLGKILQNLKASGAGEQKLAANGEKPGRKLEVDDFVISGGKVRVSLVGLAGRSAELPLPEIVLKDLGTGPEGITAGELMDRVLTAVITKSLEVSASVIGDVGNEAAGLTKNAAGSAADAAGKATKGISGLFKRKE